MNDYIKTTLFLGLLSIFIVLLGGTLGGQDGTYLAFMFAIVMNVGGYFFSDKIALAISGAKELTQEENPKIHRIVEELALTMGLPKPRVYIIDSMQANAFATGRNPRHAAIAVTRGITSVLNEEELKAVLAHELGHIKNRDILISTIAAVLASTLTVMARTQGRTDKDLGILGVVLALFAPIGALIVQMAISRDREFEADETAAETLNTGRTLSTALIKIHESAHNEPLNVNPAFSNLYIANPFGVFSGMSKLFATHPPVEERIKRLTKYN
ncbi:MAG: M48 family metalloprotease [Patescibacteria group bacterium]|uniref:Protease HtpX homolog n=1 Tax=candidate division WWE3 bacterium TaxID=2053526 RepID=A0A955J206_UNCKA|nr:M48 family metalloprotease [candidate division WWE3 bacterium]